MRKKYHDQCLSLSVPQYDLYGLFYDNALAHPVLDYVFVMKTSTSRESFFSCHHDKMSIVSYILICIQRPNLTHWTLRGLN